MAKVVAEEVMTEFNTRSDLGRVVVNPPTRMSPLELHDTLPMYLCCGRAFLSEESYVNHKAETIVHGKPIDLTNIRTAINARSSIAFWRSRKINAAKVYEDEEEEECEEEEQNQETCEQDDGEDWNEDFDEDMSQEMVHQQKQPKSTFKVAKRVRQRTYKTCELCNLEMPGTNIPRHLRTCHDPSNQFVCKYCTCRFVGAYGRLIHELKSHKKNKKKAPAVRIAKKLISGQKKKLPLKPSVPVPLRSEQQGFDTKSVGYVKLSSHSYQCSVCKKTFQCANNAKDHLNQHTGTRPYSCSHCELTFTFKSSVGRHIKSCHVLGGGFPCPENCGCIMGNHISLQMHANLCKKRKAEAELVKTVEVRKESNQKRVLVLTGPTSVENFSIKASQVGPNLYHCDICDKDITCSGNFRDHLNSHAGSRPHKCPLCSLTFTFRSNIQRHIKTSHVEDGAYVCPNKCGCVLGSLVALKGHMFSCRKKMRLEALLRNIDEPSSSTMRSPSPPKMSPIRSPSKTSIKRTLASSKKFLKRSRALSSTPALDKYECEVCKRVVISKRNLRNHMLIHLNLKPFKCELCGHFFRAIESLKKHQERSHVPTGTHFCPDCPCQFNREQGLMMHKNMYHSKKAIQKIQSQKSAALPPMPKLKPMPQLKPKPNILSSLLDKKPSKLQPQPVKTETGPFECRVCGKILQSINSFRNHGLIHSGEKPYECNICGHRFRLSSTLYDHKRSSHSGGTFMCKKCPCRFESEHGLYRHEGVFHGRVSIKFARRRANLLKKKALKLKAAKLEKYYEPEPEPQRSTSSNYSSRTSPTKNMRNRNSVMKSLPKLTPQPIRQVAFKMEVDEDNDSNGFQCGHCGVFLQTLQALSDHQRIHTQPEPEKPLQQCPVCSQRIFDSSHYKLHMKSNHSGGEYQCIECPCDFDSQGSLTRHKTRYHPYSRQSNGLGPNSRRSNGLGPVVIEVESTDHDIGFEVYDDEVREVRAIRADSNPQIAQGVSKAQKVKPVTKLHKKDLVKSCDVCGKTFLRLQSYKDHMSIHLKVRPYKCDICFQMFRLSSILSTHKRTSHGNGRFHCADCPTQFSTQKGLSVHRFVYHKGGRIKTGEKESTYEQPVEDGWMDGKDYSQNQDEDIQYGMYSNTVEAPVMQAKSSPKDRPIKCKECGATCLGPNRLQEHMELHRETEMPTECSGCGRFFGTTVEFVHHIQVNVGHHFRCGYCCATMTTEEALQEHFDAFHTQEEEEAEVSEYMESQMDLDFVTS